MRGRIALPVLLIALAGACHTDPFASAFFGANGPLVPGSEARLTFNTGDQYGHPFRAGVPSWEATGAGILYTFSPRPHQAGESLAFRCGPVLCGLASRDSLDTCLAMLPPGGGSAYWQRCETRPFHTDSFDIYSAGAVNDAGQLLYVEMTGRTDLPAPLGAHAELWLYDPARPGTTQKLLSLYNNALGVHPPTSPVVSDLTAIEWAGPGAFVAVGQHPSGGTGIVSGRITSDSAVVSFVPGTDGAGQFALVDGGGAAIVVGPDRSVRRVALPSGNVTVVAALPLSAQGALLDIGCHPTLCIVLTSDGSRALWSVALGSGSATLARVVNSSTTAARLSPVSGDVVALEGANLYLLSGVVP